MRKWKLTGRILLPGILIVVQYILAFFVYRMPGLPAIQYVGWGIWLLSMIFGFAPIFILGRRGGIPKGRSYVETTRLVDTSLYAVVRHPQYLGGILFNVALMLLAQHWLVFLTGATSAVLLYLDIQEADGEGIEQFGDEYRSYMRRVPQLNIPLGLLRALRSRGTIAGRQDQEVTDKGA